MKRIPVYKFYKHKYGDELLIDIVDYKNMWQDIRRTPVFTETFHSITLVEEGNEVVEVNGQACRARRATVICSIPGEVWRFRGEMEMQALNLIFEKEFLLSFFRDCHFLDQFGYLSAKRTSPFLQLDDVLFERLLNLYREIQREINDTERKDRHILRAMLYEALMLLSRAEMKTPEYNDSKSTMTASQYVERFVGLVNDHFTTESGTEFYADQLCITSNYLNKIVKRVLGTSTKAYIQEQRMQEACRQLRYTTLSVQEISEWLGYESATYFVRSFHKARGQTPLEYRKMVMDESPEK